MWVEVLVDDLIPKAKISHPWVKKLLASTCSGRVVQCASSMPNCEISEGPDGVKTVS